MSELFHLRTQWSTFEDQMVGDAALYWRVEGRASCALNCLRGALHFSPRDKNVSEHFHLRAQMGYL